MRTTLIPPSGWNEVWRSRQGSGCGRKLLITGAAGQLGQALVRRPAGRAGRWWPPTPMTWTSPTPRWCSGELSRQRPEVVINAAAATRVDDLESDPDRGAPGQRPGTPEPGGGLPAPGSEIDSPVHGLCLRRGQIRALCGVGRHGSPVGLWPEQAPGRRVGAAAVPRPLHRAHGLALRRCPAPISLPLFWPGRADRPGGAEVVHDQRGTPTSALALAPQLLALASTEAFGTYHATCQGETTWYEFAVVILERAGFEERKVRPLPTEISPARPPAGKLILENCLLKLERLDLMPSWEEAWQTGSGNDTGGSYDHGVGDGGGRFHRRQFCPLFPAPAPGMDHHQPGPPHLCWESGKPGGVGGRPRAYPGAHGGYPR